LARFVPGRFLKRAGPTRWATTFSSKVNLHNTINFRALCGANLVTRWSRSRQNRGGRNPRTPPCGRATTALTTPSSLARCRTNVAHTRQSKPDSGLGFQVNVRKTLNAFPFRSTALGRSELVNTTSPEADCPDLRYTSVKFRWGESQTIRHKQRWVGGAAGAS